MANPLRIWREALANYKPREFRGAYWYRAIFHTRRTSILEMDGAFLYGGRYNPPERFGALYLADSREGCAAELARRPAAPQGYLAGKIRVTLHGLCDLTDPELLAELDVTVEQLKTDDWTETQLLGTLVRDAGFEGMIVPSAAGEFNNLVIFMDQLDNSSAIELEDIQKLP